MKHPIPLLAFLLVSAAPISSGGSGDHAILVIDPANAESMYVANYYMAKRDVPAANAVYMRPGAASYVEFVDVNLEGFQGALNNRRIRDHVDYVLIPPGDTFFISAPGYVFDSCAPVNRFAVASGYTLANLTGEIFGSLSSQTSSQFALESWDAQFFDASYSWFDGVPSASGQAYFLGAMLGYTGPNGNTLQEILDMIDRSAAVDGTQPGGTFYYVETTDVARSGPRDFAYPQAVIEMAAAGGVAEHIFAVLPTGEHDCLGVMTGWASPDVDGASYTILPGAFGDHLTSFAGKFDTTSQTKISEWIEKGASGTCGTVEEPCNYSGKFPHARLHVLYRKGMTLGESWFRSMGFLPFQNLLYGDPLTRPWAFAPSVDVPAPPAGPVSGTIAIAPLAAATAPGAAIDRMELLVDGVVVETIADGGTFTLDTLVLADGWHELRVLAYDTDPARHTGRWIGELDVDNGGLAVTLGAAPPSGDLGQPFDFTFAASGSAVDEVRLLQNGRVVAASASGSATLTVYGQNLGAGPVRVQAEASFAGGGTARSAPVDVSIGYTGGAASGAAPVAFGYTRQVQDDVACVVQLPAAYDDDPAGATYTVVQPPGQATILSTGTGPYRVIRPNPSAAGLDSLTFRVDTPTGTSSVETVVIEYVPGVSFPPADFFELTAVVPAQLDSLIPGTSETVQLVGGGFGAGTTVEIDGQPIGGLVKPYTFVHPGLITLDMQQVDHLGAATITVRDGVYSDSFDVTLVPPAAPKLQMGSGDPGAVVFSAGGLDVIFAGSPGSLQVFVVSLFDSPSDLPGIVHLDLGAAFTNVPIVGVFPVDPTQAWTAVNLPLAGVPIATTIFGQTVEVGATFPLQESNLQEIFVFF